MNNVGPHEAPAGISVNYVENVQIVGIYPDIVLCNGLCEVANDPIADDVFAHFMTIGGWATTSGALSVPT